MPPLSGSTSYWQLVKKICFSGLHHTRVNYNLVGRMMGKRVISYLREARGVLPSPENLHFVQDTC